MRKLLKTIFKPAGLHNLIAVSRETESLIIQKLIENFCS